MIYGPCTTLNITNKEWYELPGALRTRWWIETGYGKNPPSEQLTRDVLDRVGVVRNDQLSVAAVLDGFDAISS